jgi:AcrR family transcriptional regulator
MDVVSEDTARVGGRGGRGARERVLRAATDLFYRQGINATGIEQLAGAARVSKRTLYQHFSSKDELIAAYVRGLSEQGRLSMPNVFGPPDRPPRERMLALFDLPLGDGPPLGCPFLKTAAELADPQHPARLATAQNKRDLIAALTKLAREAGAANPGELGRQIALLFDGAQAQSVALNSRDPRDCARTLAATLIDAAVAATPPTGRSRRRGTSGPGR